MEVQKFNIPKNVAVVIGCSDIVYEIASVFRKIYVIVNSEEVARKIKHMKNVGIVVAEKVVDFDFDVDLVLFVKEVDENYLNWAVKKSKLIVVEIDEKSVKEILKSKCSRVEIGEGFVFAIP